ncbi:unnamed protein product [Angiostrongylus costaricensis]|uniref:BHLH domain-containing protein n=1 Tax=Angiostrongylus costaricensis TaxID=334426 RepID=A0A0R3PFE4_ANGCS|nr:unnamed protein product [Angiostrongylus costaricensis]
MAHRFASADRRQVTTSIEGLRDRIRVLNAQVPNLIRGMATKSPNVAIGQLIVHVASLNVQLVQLKHKVTYLDPESSGESDAYLCLVLILQKKMFGRFNRSVIASRRLLTSDNVDADVTLWEHI